VCMSEVVHADIFFFIASLATILIAAGVLAALYYIVHILRDVRDIMRKLNKASTELERDFEELRSAVKTESTKVRGIIDVALAFVVARLKKPTVKIVRKTKPKASPADETLQ
jgi:hypothetical protein